MAGECFLGREIVSQNPADSFMSDKDSLGRGEVVVLGFLGGGIHSQVASLCCLQPT